MSITFQFDERKATEATAHLLASSSGRMKYLRIIKMLYFADRRSLQLYGRPIVGDRYVAMRHGPVLSQLYDVIKLNPDDAAEAHPIWSEHIRRDGLFLELVRSPQRLELTDAECDILDQVITDCRGRDEWEVRDLSHCVPEWSDPGATSRTIQVADMLRTMGFDEARVKEVQRAALEKEYLDSLFGV